jgi:hypothetical protein
MIRVLIIIAVAGFLVSVVTLSVAVGIAGPEAVAHGAWSWGPNGWGRDWHGRDQDPQGDATVRTTRQIAWEGGDTLTVEIPADVEITRTGNPGEVAVSGPLAAVADVEIDDGVVRYKSDHDGDPRLTLTVSSPKVTRIVMKRHGAVTLAAPPTAAQ